MTTFQIILRELGRQTVLDKHCVHRSKASWGAYTIMDGWVQISGWVNLKYIADEIDRELRAKPSPGFMESSG